MTIMSWGNSAGTKGRCDGRCQRAKKNKCGCMCGGQFHGANNRPGGLQQALQDHAEAVMEGAKRRAEAEGKTMNFTHILRERDRLHAASLQPSLPAFAETVSN